MRIHRPPANAMDQALLEEGLAVFDDVAREEPGAVVLTDEAASSPVAWT